MKPIQFLLIAFILFTLMKVTRKYKERGIRTLEFFFWTLIWIGAGLIILFPDTTNILAHRLGISRGADLVMYSSFLIVSYLIFKIRLTLDRLEQEVTEIVRALALAQLTESRQPGLDDRT